MPYNETKCLTKTNFTHYECKVNILFEIIEKYL